ncbi:MAG: HlyD family efflux transporter periplasmic adaptor subunit, partial [Planctomycetes bacterium]|nr:HlyD family efflux transporter periplasmic adaptor subunit [Planctomycetota bacterium]
RSSLVLLVLAALAMIPFPFSVRAPAVLQAEGATSLFVQQTGRLKTALPAGSPVEPGTIIGELVNVRLQRQIVQLEGSIRLLEKQLQNLEDRRGEDSEAIAALIPTTKERLAEKQDELAQRKADVEKLTLRSPVVGTVLPPRDRSSAESKDGTTLPQWTGTPLDEENRGATIEAGTEFCQVGTQGQFEAILAVDEDTIEFVSKGQLVELLFDHHPEELLTGKVSEIAEIDLDIAPPELIESGSFPTRVGEDGIARPISTAYQVRITLDLPESSTLILRGTGRARIEAASQSTARRLLRFLRRTFRFRS